MLILPAAATTIACGLLLLRLTLSLPSIIHLLRRCWRHLDDLTQSHQTFTIPQTYSDGHQLNPLYAKSLAYLSSLPSLEDSDRAHILSTGRKPNDFLLHVTPGHVILDSFRGARLSWTLSDGCFELRLRRQDRPRVLRPYLQQLEAVADEIEFRKREVRLFTSCCNSTSGVWKSVPFNHPSNFDTVVMDPELKSRVRSDLESFLKGRNYYARLGRVWKRSYLLYGPPGTGKSTFVAAMAKFLRYDIYNLDLTTTSHEILYSLLQQTTPKSVILVEDLDRYLSRKREEASLVLNFMDGVLSCCGEERVMVFTMSSGKEAVDPALLRPGRLDVHIYFPLCDFAGFKILASSYLGLRDHKLYPQVEERFQSGGKLSPAEVGEIMIANRGSPSRAIKRVIGALNESSSLMSRTSSSSSSSSSVMKAERGVEFDGGGGRGGLGMGKDVTVREFRKLYGLIKRNGSKREGTMSVEMAAAAAAEANAAAVEKEKPVL